VNDIWLNEGFGDLHSSCLWRENRPASHGPTGPAAYFELMGSRRPSSVNGSVYCYGITDENRFFSTAFKLQRRGAGWLHMLRHLMGDAQFFRHWRRTGPRICMGRDERTSRRVQGVYGAA